MSTSLIAIEPENSACVSASAGTGKTWLLVTRLVRLLVNGATPDSILAITFTRKAAAEMRQRLSQRLLEMACAADDELVSLLEAINIAPTPETIKRSRCLYEQLLHAASPVSITTFHAFCQDVLRRFPLEAGVPPGFDLSESTTDLQNAAWDLLFNEATAQPDSALAMDLDSLFEQCGSVATTKSVLDSFLQHRSDWWAWSDSAANAPDLASSKLSRFLGYRESDCSTQDFFTSQLLDELRLYQKLLFTHGTKTFVAFGENLENCFSDIDDCKTDEAFELLKNIFLTDKGEARKRSENASQEKKMTPAGQKSFIRIHYNTCDRIMRLQNALAKQKILTTNAVWYRTGARLVEYYQNLKQELRILDFTDLEWKVYQLLNQAEHAHWVQYKLDSRINHFLIDEFQDTNPTQWHLILPLLEELASSENLRKRSVFIVGDSKQSIYRFRRADPALFDTAQTWLTENINASMQPLDKSWRSAPVIMDCVNSIFRHESLQENIKTFTRHGTHLGNLWGSVEVMPLILPDDTLGTTDTAPLQSNELRNPLKAPRVLRQDTRHYREGMMIAEKINLLINSHTAVSHNNATRQIDFGDILILIRQRTHSGAYEQALRDNNIPYTGANRGTLLDCLEIRDMVALLEILLTPWNDIALASVLRSPLFACSNDDLIQLARLRKGSWMDRLAQLAAAGDSSTITHAYTSLSTWHQDSGKLPVHDLLDKIFLQGNVIQRYTAASPPHLRQRVSANLIRFIELALEVDSGRYPGTGHFLRRLKTRQSAGTDAPDEAITNSSSARVRIMTIHSSKGLEAPVVFLADAASSKTANTAHQTLVDWPENATQPALFMLPGKKKEADDQTLGLLEKNQSADNRENANLLYVALTRAKQYYFISGCQPVRGKDTGWYGMIRKQLSEDYPAAENINDTGSTLIVQDGEPALLPDNGQADSEDSNVATPEISPDLSRPFQFTSDTEEPSPHAEISPDNDIQFSLDFSGSDKPEIQTCEKIPGDQIQTRQDAVNPDFQLRGILIHRALQLACEGMGQNNIEQQLVCEYPEADVGLISVSLAEGFNVFNHHSTQALFNSNQYTSSFNEVPVQYSINEKQIYGIIDRLIVYPNHIKIIDYKTHIDTSQQEQHRLALQFKSQLERYRTGIQKVWSGKKIYTLILFTHNIKLQDIDDL